MSTKIDKNEFGNTIKKAREKKDLGLREAARKLKINAGYLSSLENNIHSAIPSSGVVKKIAELLGLDFEELEWLAVCADSDIRGLNSRLSKADMQGMLLFYRLCKKHAVHITTAYEIIKDHFERTKPR